MTINLPQTRARIITEITEIFVGIDLKEMPNETRLAADIGVGTLVILTDLQEFAQSRGKRGVTVDLEHLDGSSLIHPYKMSPATPDWDAFKDWVADTLFPVTAQGMDKLSAALGVDLPLELERTDGIVHLKGRKPLIRMANLAPLVDTGAVVLIGRARSGKTTFAIRLARDVMKYIDGRVNYLSSEADPWTIVSRFQQLFPQDGGDEDGPDNFHVGCPVDASQPPDKLEAALEAWLLDPEQKRSILTILDGPGFYDLGGAAIKRLSMKANTALLLVVQAPHSRNTNPLLIWTADYLPPSDEAPSDEAAVDRAIWVEGLGKPITLVKDKDNHTRRIMPQMEDGNPIEIYIPEKPSCSIRMKHVDPNAVDYAGGGNPFFPDPNPFDYFLYCPLKNQCLMFPACPDRGGTPQIIKASVLKMQVCDTLTAVNLCRRFHSRLPRTQQNPWTLCFKAQYEDVVYGVALWHNPSARGLPDSWLELRRLAVTPDAPRYTASRMLGHMVRYLKKHTNLEKCISYQDLDVHLGTIYKAAGWFPEYFSHPRQRDRSSNRTGTSRKYRSDCNDKEPAAAGKIRWSYQLQGAQPSHQEIQKHWGKLQEEIQSKKGIITK